MSDVYCEIFVNWENPDEQLAQFIAQACGGLVCSQPPSTYAVETAEANISIQPGPYFRGSRYFEGKDAFLRYPRLLEIHARTDVQRSDFVNRIAGLLRSFWSRGVSAVATSDFESSLRMEALID